MIDASIVVDPFNLSALCPQCRLVWASPAQAHSCLLRHATPEYDGGPVIVLRPPVIPGYNVQGRRPPEPAPLERGWPVWLFAVLAALSTMAVLITVAGVLSLDGYTR